MTDGYIFNFYTKDTTELKGRKERERMIKTHKERQAFFDRIENKYKEKLVLQNYRDESMALLQKLKSLRGMRVDQLNGDSDILEFPDYRPTYS
jgi:hypothetical protein